MFTAFTELVLNFGAIVHYAHCFHDQNDVFLALFFFLRIGALKRRRFVHAQQLLFKECTAASPESIILLVCHQRQPISLHNKLQLLNKINHIFVFLMEAVA